MGRKRKSIQKAIKTRSGKELVAKKIHRACIKSRRISEESQEDSPRENNEVFQESEPKQLLKYQEEYLDSQFQTKNTIFRACNPVLATQMDFDIFCYQMSKSKIYGVCLLDQQGRIVYTSKVANQLFQGCLNNFQKSRFMDMILLGQRQELLEKLRKPITCRVVKYIIYSKNAKRRYSQKQPSIQTEEYLFFRYLKCLVSRIRPLLIDFPNPQQIPGYWNMDLVTTHQQKTHNKEKMYYLLETKLSEEIPCLLGLNLLRDERIQKYEQVQSNKRIRSINLSLNLYSPVKLFDKIQKDSEDLEQVSKVPKIKLEDNSVKGEQDEIDAYFGTISAKKTIGLASADSD